MNAADRKARLQARILRNVKVYPETGCWIWQRRLNNWGYPIINERLPGGSYPYPKYAHRVSFSVFVRTVRTGYQIDHICCNPPCVNPEHLQEVLGKTNITFRDKRRELRWRDHAAAQAA